ncbi:MAG: hypothetical protein ABH864_02780 [archaeon]
MAGEEVINATTEIAGEILLSLGSIGRWLQAIGAIIILWLIFQIINWVLNRKRIKRLDKLSDKLDEIEKKIDKAIKKH